MHLLHLPANVVSFFLIMLHDKRPRGVEGAVSYNSGHEHNADTHNMKFGGVRPSTWHRR